MKLIGLLVLLGLVLLVEGDVVESFTASCPQFFLNEIPPTVLTDQNNQNRYRQICQKYKNAYRFATLYDTSNRIPVYSAYVYQEKTSSQDRKWRTEPQLSEATQAVDEDYKGSGYTRGHVNPRCFNCDPRSTDILTNVAPQTDSDNGNWERQVETPLKEKIKRECNLENNLAYIVTGVIPGQTLMNNRVNIPNYFWTAFSCLKKDQSSCMSGGYLLEMTKKTTEQMKNKEAVKATFYDEIDDLNRELSELYHLQTPFTVFSQPTSTALSQPTSTALSQTTSTALSQITSTARGLIARCIDWFRNRFPAWLGGRG